MTFDAGWRRFAVSTVVRIGRVLYVIERGIRFCLAPLRIVNIFRKYDGLVGLRRARSRNRFTGSINSMRRVSAVRWQWSGWRWVITERRGWRRLLLIAGKH